MLRQQFVCVYFCILAATDACAQYMSSDQVDLIRIDEELGDSSLEQVCDAQALEPDDSMALRELKNWLSKSL